MSWALWITGRPGSGKSVIARAAVAELRRSGAPVVHLEVDRLCEELVPTPAHGDVDRDAVHRAVIYMATALTGAGVPVVIDGTGHRRAWRELAREAVAAFAEVQLVCPPEICQERVRARGVESAPRTIAAGAAVPLDVPYEPALSPDVVIDTKVVDATAAARRIVSYVRDHCPASPRVGEIGRRWAIWITGLPGSGKTTIALGVAKALASRGIAVAVVESAALRHAMPGAAGGGERHDELVYRALIRAASVLTDAGVATVVDATAPRRAWRETARHAIRHFAEVQLVCPREVCLERERAVRWHLVPSPEGHVRPADAPHLVLDYENALFPDLVLQTHVEGVWTAVDAVLRLALRLHGEADDMGGLEGPPKPPALGAPRRSRSAPRDTR